MMKTEEHINCSFCGKDRTEVDMLIVGTGVAICNECVDLSHQVVHNRTDRQRKVVSKFNPVDLKRYLDQFVIGQDSAKVNLCVAVANHYKRVNHAPKELRIEKSNVILIGPTGSGKTLLAKSIADYLDVPFAIGDATTLTQAGYVGDDVESLIHRLLMAANWDVERAQRGIIFIDEIDKIGKKGESANITRDLGEGTQQALLKLVEGTTCRVPPNGGRKHPGTDMIDVDTKNILFIASGAFVGLDKLIQERAEVKSIGFGANIEQEPARDVLKKIEPDDLMKFGLIPEFIGRFPVITSTEELTRTSLVEILTDTKNSLLKQYHYLFQIDNLEVEFENGCLEGIADRAVKLKTGARGLKNILETMLTPWQFKANDLVDKGVKRLVFTRDCVDGSAEPVQVMERSRDKSRGKNVKEQTL